MPSGLQYALFGVACAVHPDRLAQIEEIQAKGALWVTGETRFSEDAPGASKSLCGVKANYLEEMEKAIAEGRVERQSDDGLEDQAFPDHFDSEENWPHCAKIIGDIRDQSNCGCCWAFAGAEAASDRLCIATEGKMMMPISAQDVCFCGSDDGCDGGFINEPWEHIQRHGSVTGGQYQGSGPFGKGMCADFSLPHCHHHGPQGSDPYPAEGKPGCPSQTSPQCPTKCDAEAAGPHSDFEADKLTFSGKIMSASGELGIMKAIMEGGPVETAFTVYSDFENYAGGIYHHVTGEMAGGHAVRMVGWGVEDGVKYWKVANSWNPYWAEKGYFRIRKGHNEGGIENSVSFAAPSAKWSKKSEQIII
jgi:cathepsin B